MADKDPEMTLDLQIEMLEVEIEKLEKLIEELECQT